MIAVRREDAQDWPCPWYVPGYELALSSAPSAWELTKAVEYVRANRADDHPIAVYKVTHHGQRQRRIYPQEVA